MDSRPTPGPSRLIGIDHTGKTIVQNHARKVAKGCAKRNMTRRDAVRGGGCKRKRWPGVFRGRQRVQYELAMPANGMDLPDRRTA